MQRSCVKVLFHLERKGALFKALACNGAWEIHYAGSLDVVNVPQTKKRQYLPYCGGDYYFHSVLVMVFLVNIISLCAFSIPLTDASGRLGHVSTSFLAVLAYRYVIDESLPRKEYLTAADVYIIFACSFQVVICIETVILSLLISQLDEEAESIFRTYTYIDRSLGTALLVIWLAVNAYLRYLWKSGQKETWQNVYKSNKEPCIMLA